jgi:hypothetical protein
MSYNIIAIKKPFFDSKQLIDESKLLEKTKLSTPFTKVSTELFTNVFSLDNLEIFLNKKLTLDGISFTIKQLLDFLREELKTDPVLKGGALKHLLNNQELKEDFLKFLMDIDLFFPATEGVDQQQLLKAVTRFITEKLEAKPPYNFIEKRGYLKGEFSNIRVGNFIDITHSTQDFDQGYQSIANCTAIIIKKDLAESLLVFPEEYSSYNDLKEKQQIESIGCSIEHLKKLRKPFLYMLGQFVFERRVATDEFIEELYQPLYSSYSFIQNDEEFDRLNKEYFPVTFAKDIESFFENHIPSCETEALLALLLDIPLLAYETYGGKTCSKEKKAFFSVLWKVVFQKNQEIGKAIENPKTQKGFFQQCFDSMDESVESFENFYDNLIGWLYLYYTDPSGYECFTNAPNLIQIFLNKEKKITIKSPTGLEKLTKKRKWEYPVLLIKKVQVISAIIFKSSWFQSWNNFLSTKEKKELTNKLVKPIEALEIFSKNLNIKDKFFLSYTPRSRDTPDLFIYQWSYFCDQWNETLNESIDLSFRLKAISRILSVAYLLDSKHPRTSHLISTYGTLLIKFMIDAEKLEKDEWTNFHLPFLSMDEMIYTLFLSIDPSEKNLCKIIPFLLSQISSNFTHLCNERLVASMKKLLHPFILQARLESKEDILALAQIIRLLSQEKATNLKKQIIDLEQEQLKNIVEIQKEETIELERKKVLKLIQSHSKENEKLKVLKEIEPLLSFYASTYFLGESDSLTYWLELYIFFSEKQNFQSALKRLEEILDFSLMEDQ